MGKYLLKLNNTFYYRKRIPQQYSIFFSKKTEIRVKMVAKSQITSILEAKKINLLYGEMLMTLRLDTFEQKEQIVDKYMKMMNNAFKEAYYSNSSEINTMNLEFEQMQCKQSLNTPVSHLASSQINEVFKHSDIDTTNIDQKIYKLIERLYLSKKIDMLQDIIHIVDPKNNLITSNTTVSNSEPTKKANITFSELYSIFIKEKTQEAILRGKKCITASTMRDYESTYKDVCFILIDAKYKDISEFNREDFREFSNALNNHIPINRVKITKYKNLSYTQLKQLRLNDEEKQAHNTKLKKTFILKQIFDIATDERYGYVEKNYAEAFVVKKLKKSRATKFKEEKSKPLRTENLKKLFGSKIYTNNLEYNLQFKAEKYWIPIIALFSGMRQNEICQLHVSDIRIEVIKSKEKVYYFNLNEDEEGKHLKNENAFRNVPIHPKLIEMGLLDYIKNIKKKHKRLWPNLRLHPKEDKYNTDYTKSFREYFRRNITKEKKQVFHSLRHNVSGQLLKQAVHNRLPKALINQLMGHTSGDKDTTSEDYFQGGYGIEELNICMKTLEWNIQIPSQL